MAHYVHTCALVSTVYVQHINGVFCRRLEASDQLPSCIPCACWTFKYKSGDEIVQGPEGASLFCLFRCPSNCTFHMGSECPSTTIRLACDKLSRNFIHFNPMQEALHSISSCWSMYNLCTRIWNPARGNIQKWSSADFIVCYSRHSWLPCGSSDLL